MHKSKGKLSGVLHKGFKPDKCKTALRMAVARIKLLRNRKEAQVRQMRREVAQLLEANQDMTARIRVEHVIREEKFMQAYDLIEVYCELIVARLSIIDSQKICPIDLKEAIASVIFASVRCSDVTELADVRKHFTSKYGKEFAAAALEVRPDSGVNRLVIEKLSAGAPDVQTKVKTLTSIAEEHGIKWEPKAFEESLQKPNEDLLHGSAAYYGANVSTMGSSTSNMSTSQPTYSNISAATVDSTASHVPTGPYSPAEVSANNAFSQESRRASSVSVPPSSEHVAPTSSSAHHGSNNFSHGNPGGQSVSRPYPQYDMTSPDTISRNEEINLHRERKPSVSSANWNMEFKDATSAAQAAAESAEMASIAARAAVQLASRGNYAGEQSAGPYDSPAYSSENTLRKQPAEHLVNDEKRSFFDQNSGINDPRMMSSNARNNSAVEKNHVDGQNISTAHTPSQQFRSYSPESHTYVYDMPTEPPRAHSPEPPRFDGLYGRESSIGRSEVHPFDFPGEKLQGTAHVPDVEDVETRKGSTDQESTNDHYGISSSHGTFIHGGSTIWENHNDETRDNSSAAVFDQYDCGMEGGNLFDTISSKHTEQLSGVQDNMGTSAVDWSPQHRSESPTSHRASTLFSKIETQPSNNFGANRRDLPSAHSYDNLPPTFDSDGGSSDEEIITPLHVESLRSHSRGSTSTILDKEANRNSEKLTHDVNESIEDYDSGSRKNEMASSGLNVSYKEQYGGRSVGSPRFDYSGAQPHRNLNHVQSSDSDLSDEETVPVKFEGTPLAGANDNQLLPFAMQTPAAADGKDETDSGLNLGRLTPGLRNKLRQPPSYTKNSRENILTQQSLLASTEKSVDSKDTRSNPQNSLSRRTSGGNYNSELYDRNQSVGTRTEARSTISRNFFDSDGTKKLSEQSGKASPIITKNSALVDSSQELYHEKPGIGARPEIRSRIARTYFDSDDSEEELEQRQTPLSKRSGEAIQSHRTREVTSDTKRDGRTQTGPQYSDLTESSPRERKAPQAFNHPSIEQRRDAPVYSRVAVQRSSPKADNAGSMAGGKSREAEMSRSNVPENEGNTETSAGILKENTPKTPPAHVHPKLPTDYDSFAAHFLSLRTNGP